MKTRDNGGTSDPIVARTAYATVITDDRLRRRCYCYCGLGPDNDVDDVDVEDDGGRS